MSNSTDVYRHDFSFLRQYSPYRDLRHLIALAWMVSALICSGQLSLPAWEAIARAKSSAPPLFSRRHRPQSPGALLVPCRGE